MRLANTHVFKTWKLTESIFCGSFKNCFDGFGIVGLKTLLSVQSTRQLDESTTASLALTWQPEVGIGLQLNTSRQLTDSVSGAPPPRSALAMAAFEGLLRQGGMAHSSMG